MSAKPPAARGPAGLLRSFVGTRRRDRLRQAIARHRVPIGRLGVALDPARVPDDGPLHDLETRVASLKQRLEAVVGSKRYFSALRTLQATPGPEDLAAIARAVDGRVVEVSQVIWRAWLNFLPTRFSAKDRAALSALRPILDLLRRAGGDSLTGAARKQPTNVLLSLAERIPAVAATSLSVRGRVPLAPGLYDLVVFDEASQCDVASALPLVFRAKRAVAIGDPRQLRHIAGLSGERDAAVGRKYGIEDLRPHWSHSAHSLYDRTAARVGGNAVVMLRDHHRSHADIIGVSNRRFYREALRVVTRHDRLHAPDEDGSGVRWVDVRGRCLRPRSGSLRNDPEADAVVEQLRGLIETAGFSGTVGVVTPFRAQAKPIAERVARSGDLATRP